MDPHPLSPEGLQAPLRQLVPRVSPLRDIGNWRPPRYVPGPLAEGTVRVELSDDYYVGANWHDYPDGNASMSPPEHVFDVPQEQRDRWEVAEEAYHAMQAEISALLKNGTPAAMGRTQGGYQPQP